MNAYTRLLVAALLIAPVVSVSATPIVIPRDTVIPVTLDKAMSSATSRAGNTFYVHQSGINGEGFPDNTKFTGNVDSVTRASGKTAGQIGVSFVGAKMPNGTRVPIVGQLVSLDDSNVTTDASTGRLVGTTNAKKANLKLTAIGAGAGLLLGEISGKNKILYTALGAAGGFLYGQKKAAPAVGKDVRVEAGTRFGILLGQDVTIPGTGYAAMPASVGAGANVGPGWQVTFNNLRPVMVGDDLMVPFRSVMDSIDMPFDYDSSTGQIRVSDYDSQAMHTVGTSIVNINGKNTRLDTASRIMNGSIYVPASFIELLTKRSAYWNQRSGVLRIE